jgi:hypothetical protein
MGGAGGVVQAGGASGMAQVDSGTCSFHSNPADCGTCTLTLTVFCNGLCDTLGDVRCREPAGLVSQQIERGCGYRRVTYHGDVGDAWGEIYSESTGTLVYAWNNGRRSAGCVDALGAGVEPACEAWHATTCADLEPRDAGVSDAGDAE